MDFIKYDCIRRISCSYFRCYIKGSLFWIKSIYEHGRLHYSEIDQIFQNIRKVDNGLVDHSYDETGNSKEYQIAYLLKDVQEDDHIRLQCTDWSKKLTKEKNWTDSFNVGAYSKEILDWFIGGYK